MHSSTATIKDFVLDKGNNIWVSCFDDGIRKKDDVRKLLNLKLLGCLPKEKVALACVDCKTVTEKGGEDKKGILSWFKPDSMHDCSGCKGRITGKSLDSEFRPNTISRRRPMSSVFSAR